MKTRLFGSRLCRMAVVSLSAILFLAVQAQAAEFKPTKPISFVVPYAPGGGSDVYARAIDNVIKTEKLMDQRFVIENKPGGSATIGTTAVAHSPGNDHMLLTFISGQVSGPLVVGKGAATYRDLTMICNLAKDEQFIVVKADSPFKTIGDLVAAAKKTPGSVTIAGTQVGGEDQMCNRLFEKAADIKLRYIPFNSGGECITALLGGHVSAIWANPGEFIPQYEAKAVRALAVANDKRVPLLNDIPTFMESGYKFEFDFFRGIAAPPKIGPEVVAYYENLMKRMSDSTAWKEGYLKKYMLSPAYLGSKEMTPFVAKNEKLFGDILKELGLIK
ncbi:MAG: tripartite tricarboxylate transporter substrate binding protein [Deltaproteobacteria bacterium]|nr:tripartite tricarboxylate transporter substrate binding protein [Deltaproteobacteria bacterium]